MTQQNNAPILNQNLNTRSYKRRIQKLLKRLRILKKKQLPWHQLARRSQRLPKGRWKVWLIMAGRGFGKTRTGAETVKWHIQHNKAKHIALIGQSIREVRTVMVFGESGLMGICDPQPHFSATEDNVLICPNGAKIYLLGANNPEKLRGPQFDFVWMDEMAKFKDPKAVFDQVMMCLRLGPWPRCMITTTPRPIPLLKELVQDPSVVVTTGTTYDNAANLPDSFLGSMRKMYGNTRLGLQELQAQLLEDTEGALWRRELIRYHRPKRDDAWQRIVIAIDPATTYHDKSDETGIVVAGLHEDGHIYILNDFSGRYSPLQWGQKVAWAYGYYKADRVVAEVNKGGDLVERLIKSVDDRIAYKGVHATRGKMIRAEPVAALYEQQKVYHIKPFLHLEQQLCDWTPLHSSKSPDRLDALVWAVTDLFLVPSPVMPRVWL